MTKNYSALHESMQTRTLANGLRICYLPKEGFSKTFAQTLIKNGGGAWQTENEISK